jgi:hypothetical protein
MHHCSESIFKVDYLREYESIYETALAHESVNPGVLFDEKTRGPKSRETVPLKVFNLSYVSTMFAKFFKNLQERDWFQTL